MNIEYNLHVIKYDTTIISVDFYPPPLITQDNSQYFWKYFFLPESENLLCLIEVKVTEPVKF